MDNVSNKLDLQTRGDFRRMSESAQQQSGRRESNISRLYPLWETMAGTWSSFVSLYGESPNPSWVVALADFTEAQIFSGYERAKMAGLEFPPNLSVFIDYCQGNQDWESRRLHKPYDPYAEICDRGEGRYLEAPKDNRTPEEHIAEMKRGLK